MKKHLILFSAIVVLFSQCTPEELPENTPTDGTIIGCWVNQTYQTNTVTYESASALEDNAPGFCFNEDGTLVERKNVSFCGTPPITYGDFDGTWTQEGSILTMNVDSWSGNLESSWELVSVDGENLILKYVP